MNQKSNVLITGIGGASLGTEVFKSLLLSDNYKIYGCDISEFAYGHYQDGFEKTFTIERNEYIESILEICKKYNIEFIVPGSDESVVLLDESSKIFKENDIGLAINSSDVIKKYSNKIDCFKNLSNLGFKVPLTMNITNKYELENMIFPCVVKPATGSGGSSFVFLANDIEEASIYVDYILKNEKIPLVQEYISEDEGEFTVGVLSFPNKEIACSIALKRLFNSKLSVLTKSKFGIISSGYSQGLIDEFPELCKISEDIASSIGSECAINVQGRVKDGIFLPFEINPRFSASTYLRSLAGVNEIDMYLQYLKTGVFEKPKDIRYGYYLRTLSETFVTKEDIKE